MPGSKRVSTAAMLDRDGVINTYRPGRYVNTVEDFEFIPGALEALRLLHLSGIRVFVISNQAGVGKGRMTESALARITEHMKDEIERHGGRVDGVYYCTHDLHSGCSCRKPEPGMILEAAARHRFPLTESWFIGDSEVDLGAARAAGCRSAIVWSGKTTREDLERWEVQPDWRGADLLEAARFLAGARA